ncbi:MAG: hypothetical protein R3D69_09470 [Xanthobacteraceae bacterium]
MTIFLTCLIGWFVTAALLAFRDGERGYGAVNSALATFAGLILYFSNF